MCNKKKSDEGTRHGAFWVKAIGGSAAAGEHGVPKKVEGIEWSSGGECWYAHRGDQEKGKKIGTNSTALGPHRRHLSGRGRQGQSVGEQHCIIIRAWSQGCGETSCVQTQWRL